MHRTARELGRGPVSQGPEIRAHRAASVDCGTVADNATLTGCIRGAARYRATPSTCGPRGDSPRGRGPYEILDCENLRRVSGRGFIYEDLAGRTIRATSESVSHYRFGFQNPGVRFQRLRIEPLSGCDVEQVAAMGHHFVETLRLIPPLGTKEILRFRVAHRLFKMSGTPQPFTSNIFRSRVHRLLDRVAFPLQHLPARVWWYGDVPPEDRPAAWQKLRELEVDSLGIVEAEFRAIRRNRAYGIAWEW